MANPAPDLPRMLAPWVWYCAVEVEGIGSSAGIAASPNVSVHGLGTFLVASAIAGNIKQQPIQLRAAI
jgi:hypothetical protein